MLVLWLASVFGRLGALLLFILIILWFLPLALAGISIAISLLRHGSWTAMKRLTDGQSAIYSGRVWHVRYRPVAHAFTYPLFMFCLELDELEQGLFQDLWPLTWIVKFRESDHLINGEGTSLDKNTIDQPNQLRERICRLVAQKTQQEFQPQSETHRVLLVTHLAYYGYCFNPISLYYIQNRSTGRTEAMVGEVSNTPWNEMYPYVLHPESVDRVTVTRSVDSNRPSPADEPSPELMQYSFPKTFHVSPFMEMEYRYEWMVHEIHDRGPIHVTMDMQPTSATPTTSPMGASSPSKQFSARLQLSHRYSMHPYRLAWQVASYPFYCLIIQLWIHYEAVYLFLKGVAYQPHPRGSETTASRFIGSIMEPFYAIQAYMKRKGD